MSTSAASAIVEKAKPTGRFAWYDKFQKHLRKFVKKPNHWFIFLGAAIVFLTFIVKEGVREHVKDTLGSFESAQAAFELREQHRSVMTTLTDLRDRVMSVDDRLSKQPRVNNNIPYWSATVQSTREELQLTEQLLANMVAVNAKLPRDSKRDALEAESQRITAEADAHYLPALKSISDILDRMKLPNRKLRAEEERSIQTAVVRYLESQEAAAMKIAAFSTSVLQEVPRYREEKERSLSRWNVASYFLYVVGWGLGLLGKIYDVELDGE